MPRNTVSPTWGMPTQSIDANLLLHAAQRTCKFEDLRERPMLAAISQSELRTPTSANGHNCGQASLNNRHLSRSNAALGCVEMTQVVARDASTRRLFTSPALSMQSCVLAERTGYDKAPWAPGGENAAASHSSSGSRRARGIGLLSFFCRQNS